MPHERDKAKRRWRDRLGLTFFWWIAIQFCLAGVVFPIVIATFTTGLATTTYAANLLVAILIGASFDWLAINTAANARRICEKQANQ